jgi:nitrate/nitrite transporter NarK
MTEKITVSLRDSKKARWTALAVVAFTMFCGYFIQDVLSPIKRMLETNLDWTSTDFGIFRFSYGWLTVFLFMLIIGGIILDKLGERITGIIATAIMVAGTAVMYAALVSHGLAGKEWHILFWTMKAPVFVVSIGFAIFCMGVEIAGITVSKIIVKWFKGKELALAMGLEMATARIGTAFALGIMPFVAASHGLTAPMFLGLILIVIGFVAFLVYTFMDKKLDASLAKTAKAGETASAEEQFKLSDVKYILKNRGFWLIAILCVLFYSAVFPFLNYAADLMINKFHVNEKLAGLIPMLLPFGTIILTPFFGNLYDRKGKGATIMIIGSLLLIFVHAAFSIPFLNQTVVAIILVIILGIAFSLVPSAMWPSVPKIIPEKQLGSAYALIFWIQNIGLMFIPLIIGQALDKYCIIGKTIENGKTITHYDYTLPMIIFTSLGIFAIIFALMLKAEDKRKGYGLEKPNMETR